MYVDKFARRSRPTAAQKAAYNRLLARGGWDNVTPADARELATMRRLTASQREYFAAIAQAAETVANQ